jgi:hypothetical protein
MACNVDLATVVIKMNIALVGPYQISPFLSTKALESICLRNPLLFLECSKEWHLPRNTLVVSCIRNHITNNVFTDIQVGRYLVRSAGMVSDSLSSSFVPPVVTHDLKASVVAQNMEAFW